METQEQSEYKLVRTYSAGVFFAKIESRNGKEGVLIDARRIWYWKGAASLSELAMKGTNDPINCKFPIAVNKIIVTEIIEILDVTLAAEKSMKAVPEWKA